MSTQPEKPVEAKAEFGEDEVEDVDQFLFTGDLLDQFAAGEFLSDEDREKVIDVMNCPCLEDDRSGPCAKANVMALGCYIATQTAFGDSDEEMAENIGECLPLFKIAEKCRNEYPDLYQSISEDPQEKIAEAKAEAAEKKAGGEGKGEA
eukprot:TRINITY_DN372_c2_g1_i1.p1 TRINITY_DN372_c2_g1~~TRINITY_DN372_c2_g1_i1.p1  ORF type:complete len:149 (+),score=43.27 TRINITY_DN372_c2_g1_i1:139-585(+)